jgi:glutathione S-transferase
VPVLVTPEGAIGESGEILAWIDARLEPERRLFPGEPVERREVERLCERFDTELGPKARRLIYVHMLEDRPLAMRFNNDGVPRWENRAIHAGWSLVERVIRRVLGISPGIEVADEADVWREFDYAASLLADGRAHLCGERFTAADLTFAALAAAVIVPPNYGVRLPQPEAMKAPTAALVRRARAHPAGAYAMTLFARRDEL